jgi:hypothetical protein
MRRALLAAALATLALPAGAGAASGSITFIRDGNVFVSAPDGTPSTQVTTDGSPSAPYLGAARSAAGVVVAIRDRTAHSFTQSGQRVAAPVELSGAIEGGAVSPDGRTVAHVDVDQHFCGLVPQPTCASTFFTSLETGRPLPGMGVQMTNPVWAGSAEVVGATFCGVYRAAPDRTDFQAWINRLAEVGLGDGCVIAAAATEDGTRLAVSASFSSPDRRTLFLMTAAGLGGAVTPRCEQAVAASGPQPHPVLSPEGDAVAWEEADGIWIQRIVDLSGSVAGCRANAATARLAIPGAIRPMWSSAAFDTGAVSGPGPSPGPVAPGGPGPAPTPDAGPAGRATLRFLSTPRLRRGLRAGLALSVSCPQRCRASARARIDRRTARRFRLGRRAKVVARARAVTVSAGRTRQLQLRFTRRARRRLARARRVALHVAVALSYPTQRETRRTTITLRR